MKTMNLKLKLYDWIMRNREFQEEWAANTEGLPVMERAELFEYYGADAAEGRELEERATDLCGALHGALR